MNWSIQAPIDEPFDPYTEDSVECPWCGQVNTCDDDCPRPEREEKP